MREQLLGRISIDPKVCSGKPCIRGHRIWVSLVLDLLARGRSVAELIEDYPGITSEDILACIAYAAELVRCGGVDMPTERHASAQPHP